MANEVNGPTISVTLGATVAAVNTLIKMSSAGVGILTTGVASEDNTLVGAAMETGVSGDVIAVRVFNCVASSKVKMAGAVTKGAGVFTAASGLGSATATSLTRVGIAMEAATAANDIIQVLHVAGGNDDLT